MEIKVYSNIQEEGRVFKVRIGSLMKVLLLFSFLFLFFIIGKIIFGLSMWFILFVLIPPFVLFIYFRFFDKDVDPFSMEKRIANRVGKKTIKADCIEF